MRNLASLLLALAVTLACLSGQVSAADTQAVILPVGDIGASLITAFSNLIAALVGPLALYLVGRIFGAPGTAAVKAAHIDALLEAATNAGLARVAGAVRGETLAVKDVPTWLSEALTFLEIAGKKYIDDAGGIDAAAQWLTAYASRKGIIPPEASAAHFS